MIGGVGRGLLPALCALPLLCGALLLGCNSGPPEVPVDINEATTKWMELLESQVVAGDFNAAVETAEKLQTEGAVAADQLNDYMRYRALAQIGTGQYVEAQATLDELERGIDDPAELHVLRGHLAAAQGIQTLADAEYAKARQLNPRVKIAR